MTRPSVLGCRAVPPRKGSRRPGGSPLPNLADGEHEAGYHEKIDPMMKLTSRYARTYVLLGVFLAAVGSGQRSKAGSITLLPSASGDYVQPFGQPAHVDQSFQPVTSTT